MDISIKNQSPDIKDKKGLDQIRDDLIKSIKSLNPDKSIIRISKKSIIEMMIRYPGGSSLRDMGLMIRDLGIDDDLDKNIRVARLWISKLGYRIIRIGDKYYPDPDDDRNPDHPDYKKSK